MDLKQWMEMTQQDHIDLFNIMHPDFFAKEHIRSIPAGETYEEMLLLLEEFDPSCYHKEFDKTVSFGFYEGELDKLQELVRKVDEGWVQFYDETERIYCGYIDGRVVSFCLMEDMGTHRIGGQKLRIAGPGCVGTLPEYRNRGIGLTMVKQVTALLKAAGYDYSYIHYTGVAPWYAKLGYQTCVCWTKDGIVPEPVSYKPERI